MRTGVVCFHQVCTKFSVKPLPFLASLDLASHSFSQTHCLDNHTVCWDSCHPTFGHNLSCHCKEYSCSTARQLSAPGAPPTLYVSIALLVGFCGSAGVSSGARDPLVLPEKELQQLAVADVQRQVAGVEALYQALISQVCPLHMASPYLNCS